MALALQLYNVANAAAADNENSILPIGGLALTNYCHNSLQLALLAMPGNDIAYVRHRITPAQGTRREAGQAEKAFTCVQEEFGIPISERTKSSNAATDGEIIVNNFATNFCTALCKYVKRSTSGSN
ncbi:hypothetical protein EAF00_006810 [Botryotinia globosa]|nr:hypothetical protein EAF00_006810 [Botryotinia globosa]